MAETHGNGVRNGVDQELDFKWIFGFVIGLTAVTAVVFGLMWGVSVWQKAQLLKKDAPAPVLPEARAQVPPSGPLLQGDPEADLTALRAHDAALLNGWAWTDASKTSARVPVSRAMEIVLAKGFPPRTAAPAAAAPPPSSGAPK